ncbi:MAG: hypothetical protein AAF391_06895 [Bacteroidota bacterium]
MKRIRKAYEGYQYQYCISECNELLVYNPKDFFGHYYKGLCFTELKLFQEALDSFESSRESINRNRARKFLKEYSCDIGIRESTIYLKMREFKKAKELLKENIKQHPNCVSSFTELSSIEEDEKNFLGAIEIINRGIESNPNNKILKDEKNRINLK